MKTKESVFTGFKIYFFFNFFFVFFLIYHCSRNFFQLSSKSNVECGPLRGEAWPNAPPQYAPGLFGNGRPLDIQGGGIRVSSDEKLFHIWSLGTSYLFNIFEDRLTSFHNSSPPL